MLNDTMEIIKKENITSRSRYRYFRKNKPDCNLPSENQICKEFGSFGEFIHEVFKLSNKIQIVKTEEKKPLKSLDVKDELIPKSIEKKILESLKIVKEKSIEKKISEPNTVEENPINIEKGQEEKRNKRIIEEIERSANIFIVKKPEPEKKFEEGFGTGCLLDEKENIIANLENVFMENPSITRDLYRNIYKENPNLPTVSSISRVFGSFSNLKSYFDNDKVEVSDQLGHREDIKELSPEELEKMKEMVKALRLEMFGDVKDRHPYRWEPESRAGRLYF